MISRLAMAVVIGSQLLAGAAMAQTAFGNVSGGQVELVTKSARKTSGSIGMNTSGNSHGYEATLGGTVLEDRLWFFGSASMLPQMPQRAAAGTVDLKMDAHLGSRNSLAATFSEGRGFGTAMPDAVTGALPSSFLSLRYTAVVSENLFFNATIMRRSATQ